MDLALWFTPTRLIQVAFLLALGLVAIFTEAAPVGLAANAYPSPDILFIVIAYWSSRRPEAAALIVVFALGLTRDLLTDVPVGAGALTLVFASEFLKAVSRGLSRRSFATEWLVLAWMLALVLLAQWLIVFVLLARPPYLIDLGYQWLATMALYPVLAVVFRGLFRIGWRKPEAA